MEIAIVLILMVLVFMLVVINLVILIFMGGGIANMGEAVMNRQQETMDDLMKKFKDLDLEIRYRLPRRPYGVEKGVEPDLTEGPDDPRIPR